MYSWGVNLLYVSASLGGHAKCMHHGGAEADVITLLRRNMLAA
jgi:hypothetical protein